ncbi:hypothetical protein GQ43DRAFT_468801 [Delitschia confertaspora ATCC 74209]|uniref:Survival motor neuron Tudor domain-containing protein n=1 Tax=Delitschia confertaspora ATCC 74209 TaxID=1513339 RepID=A0A9P4JS72_9PLEO|nr:hypothetical protein GQ43DRAFT_468801 [Delitschia confertaspora ATCC 74209]
MAPHKTEIPPVTDAEAWDDTMLQNDWEAVLIEYRKYHGIKARGKTLENSLTAEELEELRKEHGDLIGEFEDGPREAVGSLDASQQPSAKSGLAQKSEGSNGLVDFQMENPPVSNNQGSQQQSVPADPPAQPQTTTAIPAMPQTMLGGVQDENLKNMMMSWYYAGYYTGLYEGQQKAAVALQNHS